jgi:hypothetical protein
MPTLNQHLDGMQPGVEILKVNAPTMTVGRQYSFWYTPGMPDASTTPSPGMAGEALTSHIAQIPFVNAGSGLSTYVARFMMQGTAAGTWLLCDRLWQNGGITITNGSTDQTVNSVEFPARDLDGTSNGKGVLIGVEVSAATGTGTPTINLGYTNSAGTSGRLASNIIPTAASSAIGHFYPIGLQGSDVGVRSIQTYRQTATWTSGTVHLVAYRVIARLACPVANVPYSMDLITGGQPKAFNNSVPFLLFFPAAAGTTFYSGQVIWSVA